MALVLQSPEDICNVALVRVGYKRRIGSLYEGSFASKICLDVYGQTRDALLRLTDWDFSEQIAAGVISGTAPFPWSFQYAYPANCLRVRGIFGLNYVADPNDPLPVNWQTGNATIASVPVQVIWADFASATIVFTAQVTNPLTWEPLFVEALIDNLAQRVALGLSGPDAVKLEMQEAKEADAAGDARDG